MAQIARITEFTRTRRANREVLDSFLDNPILANHFRVAHATEGAYPSWFGYPLTIREGVSFTVKDVEKFLAKRKVGTRRLFAGNFLRQPAFVDAIQIKNLGMKWRMAGRGDLPNTEAIAARTFWVGLWHGLDEVDLHWIIESLYDFIQSD